MPSVELEVSGSSSVRAGYMGMISLQENRYDEAWFSPLKHIVELRLTCFFKSVRRGPRLVEKGNSV